jgi:trimeric autotransporter adhesin
MKHTAAGLISAAALGFSMTGCDLSHSMPVSLPTLQQIEHGLYRFAFRVLDEVRRHWRVRHLMADTPASVGAHSAAEFRDSIGVNVHVSFNWTAYANIAEVKNALAYLGVDKVRDPLFDWPEVQANYRELAIAGIKFDFVMPVYLPSTVKLREFVTLVSTFVQAHPDSVIAIEGPNEVNDTPASYNGRTDLKAEAELQKALYAAIRGDSNLDRIPIYNLTLANIDPVQYAELGDLSSAANYANGHPYIAATLSPAAGLAYLLPYAQLDASGLPVVITETGYNTDPNDGYSGVNGGVQAKLTLDTLLDAYKRGVTHTFIYELFDEQSDPTNSNREYHFGLFNSDGSPKLAANAIHNLTTILADHGTPATGGKFSYAVRDFPDADNQLLLQKSNGSFDLILWTEAPIWDANSRSEIASKTEASTINFSKSQKLVSIFDPLQGASPIAVYADVQSIRVPLSDHPIIIEITEQPETLPAAAAEGNP